MTTRLVDLEARWVTAHGHRDGMGVAFHCPAHPGGTCWIAVWFSNPLDGGPPAGPEVAPVHRWTASGNSIDELTLTPSIHVLDTLSDGTTRTHWHGWLRNGATVDA